jgi:MFS family permease
MTGTDEQSPWPALWAMIFGFFMILVDSTIVSVAVPALMRDLDADLSAVIWVTSAYLLTYAVPLLVTGRLGDRFGPRTIYLAGLALFTVASAACGLSPTAAARRWVCGDRWPERRFWSVRFWVGCWSTPSGGSGCSSSTCRSGCWPWWWGHG